MFCCGLDVGTRHVGIWRGDLDFRSGVIRHDYAKVIELPNQATDLYTCGLILPCFIEIPVPYGSVPSTVLATERLIGFIIGSKFSPSQFHHVYLISRPTIKAVLCGTTKATDADIRDALIQMWGGTGKGEPLYGIKKDVWAALAAATAGCILLRNKEELDKVSYKMISVMEWLEQKVK